MENIAGAIELAIIAICLIAWAIAGFPRFAEAASFGGLGMLCIGVYCVWVTVIAKK